RSSPDQRALPPSPTRRSSDLCYYDDVWARRPPSPALQLVAVDGDDVVGILDIEIDGDLATIDTVAVHPDHQGRGIASLLLDQARSEEHTSELQSRFDLVCRLL